MTLQNKKEFSNADKYQSIAKQAAQVAEAVISEYGEYYPIYGDPLFRDASQHVEMVRGIKNLIQPRLHKDFRINLIALLDIADEILRENAEEIKAFRERLQQTQDEAKKSGTWVQCV